MLTHNYLLNTNPGSMFCFIEHSSIYFVRISKTQTRFLWSSGKILNKINIENNKTILKISLKTPQSIQLLLLRLDVPETSHLPFFCLLDWMRLEGKTHTMKYSYEYITSLNVFWSLSYEYEAFIRLSCCKLFLLISLE